jgi:hypothetical protein
MSVPVFKTLYQNHEIDVCSSIQDPVPEPSQLMSVPEHTTLY